MNATWTEGKMRSLRILSYNAGSPIDAIVLKRRGWIAPPIFVV